MKIYKIKVYMKRLVKTIQFLFTNMFLVHQNELFVIG